MIRKFNDSSLSGRLVTIVTTLNLNDCVDPYQKRLNDSKETRQFLVFLLLQSLLTGVLLLLYVLLLS
jgi:hypothetical protein